MRDPATEQIVSIDTFLQNLGEKLSWQGVDLELRYVVNPRNSNLADHIWVSAVHTYLTKFVREEQSGQLNDLKGFIQNPRHDSVISIGGDRGPIRLAMQLTRRGRVLIDDSGLPATKIPPVMYIGASARFRLSEFMYVKFGIENLTDKQPPLTAFSAFNTFPNFYDVTGRRYAISTGLVF